MAGRATSSKAAKVTAPRLSPVRLEELRDEPSPDFQRGERYDGVRFSRANADGLELSGTDFADAVMILDIEWPCLAAFNSGSRNRGAHE